MDTAIKKYKAIQREDLKNATYDLSMQKKYMDWKRNTGRKISKNDLSNLIYFEEKVKEKEIVLNSLYNDKYNLSCEINN